MLSCVLVSCLPFLLASFLPKGAEWAGEIFANGHLLNGGAPISIKDNWLDPVTGTNYLDHSCTGIVGWAYSFLAAPSAGECDGSTVALKGTGMEQPECGKYCRG